MSPVNTTLADYTSSRFRMLCEGAGLGGEADAIVDAFASLVSPWAQRRLDEPWTWVSEISDDNTPIEFSVTLDGSETEVRALFETQGLEPTLASYRAAALDFHDRLESEFGACLRRFREVQDLFAPEGMCGPFAIWNSVVFRAEEAPSFKSYFNPQARGAGRSCALVEEGLRRLGFPRAWAELCRTAVRRGPWLDELKYFALDLTDDDRARVKVYVRHHAATPEELEHACSVASSYREGEALEFATAMGDRRSVFRERATFTCHAFVEGRGKRPVATTLYVPVCAYAENDDAIRSRVSQYLEAHDFQSTRYEMLLRSFADRPLGDGVGMQSWVAFRRYDDVQRLTVYLGTETGKVYPPGSVPAATRDAQPTGSTEQAVATLATYRLIYHPLISRLHAEPRADMLWAVASCFMEGVIERWEESHKASYPLTAIMHEVLEATESEVSESLRSDVAQIAATFRAGLAEEQGLGQTEDAVHAAGLCVRELLPCLALPGAGAALLPGVLHEALAAKAPDMQDQVEELAAALRELARKRSARSANSVAFTSRRRLWTTLNELYCIMMTPSA